MFKHMSLTLSTLLENNLWALSSESSSEILILSNITATNWLLLKTSKSQAFPFISTLIREKDRFIVQ